MGMAGLWQWNEQAPALVRTHRVIIPDLLWFGSSSSSRLDFSLGHQTAAVRELIDHLGLSRVDLVAGVSCIRSSTTRRYDHEVGRRASS
jgi:pimeloyl-ACP methyl ester carboxylesterase